MKRRCFIAVNCTQEIKNYLKEIIFQLKEKNSDIHVKFVDPNNIHLTLFFLGSVDENNLNLIKNLLFQIVPQFQCFAISLDRLNAFPHIDHPRIVYIEGIDKGNNLLSVYQSIGDELQKIKIYIDNRPLKAHFTLARVKEPYHFKIDDIKIITINFKVLSVDLMESKLTPQGPIYNILEKYNLNE